MALGQHTGQFIAHTLARNDSNLVGKFLHRAESLRLDLVLKSCRKPHRAQHTQFVFGKSPLRIPDGADDSSGEIAATAHVIQNFSAHRIEHHAVNREVAPGYIFLGTLAESDFVGMPSIGIADVAAECCDLDGMR